MRNQVIIGNALHELRQLPDKLAQCIVTSPPYWNLRDYGTPEVAWGDGWVGQLGLEPTWQGYVNHLTEIFQEARRVLRDDGTLWLNLGDTYVDKDLQGVPWRVIFALKDNGWVLRSEVSWHKQGMPENVSDRPTCAHEPIFMLTKSSDYYYDAEAVRHESGANRRNVWSIPPRPYAGPHSAVFPPDLPRFCIKASTSEEGACASCLSPLVRKVERLNDPRKDRDWLPRYGDVGNRSYKGQDFPHLNPPEYKTLGWEKTCSCPSTQVVGCLVLDPFAGSGTTLQEAYKHGRSYLGIEVFPEALPEIEARLEAVSGRAAMYAAHRSGIEVPI